MNRIRIWSEIREERKIYKIQRGVDGGRIKNEKSSHDMKTIIRAQWNVSVEFYIDERKSELCSINFNHLVRGRVWNMIVKRSRLAEEM